MLGVVFGSFTVLLIVLVRISVKRRVEESVMLSLNAKVQKMNTLMVG